MQPLRDMPDYGEKKVVSDSVNEYLNTPPTELKRMIEKERNLSKKKKMQEALLAWRLTSPNKFWNTQQGESHELRDVVRNAVKENYKRGI